jgi:small subunit ribosomal protein S2
MSEKNTVLKSPSVVEMLEAGMHFGHRTFKWHPKMKPYIFEARKGIHIIDLEKTKAKLEEALAFISRITSEGKIVLFVGTKNQVKGPLEAAAKAMGMPYVSQHWLGGTLTNFNIIRTSIRVFQDLTEKKELGKLEKYTKKERLNFDRRISKLSQTVGGLVGMNRTPDAIFIWDIKHEETALAEAKKKRIPIIAICDTNVNPDGIDYVIPANDDASKAIVMIMKIIEDIVVAAKTSAKEAKDSQATENKSE